MRRTILLLSLLAAAASAQVPALASGSRLKVEMVNGRKFEGTLMSQTSDSLVIAANGALITGVPSEYVGRISSTFGRSHSAGAVKGAKVGILFGGGLGVLLGVAVMNADDSQSDWDTSAAPAVLGALGAVEGAFYGVILGAIIGSQDWKEVYRRPYRVSVTPTQGRVNLGLSVTF